jgi:hypothetical protein
MLLDHRLSEETLQIIQKAVATTQMRLTIYATNWALENIHRAGAISFNPREDGDYLRYHLRMMIAAAKAYQERITRSTH